MSYEALNKVTSRGIVKNDAGKILLLRRSSDSRHNPGLLEFPGGGVNGISQEVDEAISENRLEELRQSESFLALIGATAVREIKEESGLEVMTRPPLLLVDEKIMLDAPGAKLIVFCSPTTTIGGRFKRSSEHTAHIWTPPVVALTFLYDYLTPQTQQALVMSNELGLL